MRYKWLLFDADGTLFDYDRAEAVALQRTFEGLGQGFEPDYAEAYRRINAAIWLDFELGKISQIRLRTERFDRLFAAVGVGLDSKAFSERYLRNLALGTDLVDGAKDVIRALHGRVGLMLITNGLADVQRPRFARSALNGYFAGLVISEEVGAAKPHPHIFDVAFRRMGQPRRDEVLMVGDSLTSDVRGGVDYGLDTCWFNPGRRPRSPDLPIRYEISNLREVLDLVGVSHKADHRVQEYEVVTLAGGCFWCLEAVYEQLKGVEKVESGYAGGHVPDPTYRQVTSGTTGHTEVVQITYDLDVVTFKELLKIFFTIHDPTTLNRQGADVGTQYRSAIFYHDEEQKAVAEQVIQEITQAGIWGKPIVTEVAPLDVFYRAEDYHQEYYRNNTYQPYCQVVIAPKVAKFRQKYLDKLKTES